MKILNTVLKIFGSENLNKEVAAELDEKDPDDAKKKIMAAILEDKLKNSERSDGCCGGSCHS